MRTRRGVALLAALWLVVAIAAVATDFALEARERRTVGMLTAERGQERAAELGALAFTQAQLEYALQVGPKGNNVAVLRSSDPWLDIDSTYSGEVMVDSMPVEVTAADLGEKININSIAEGDLQTFLSFVLKDYSTSVSLSQAIMDWRDADSLPRPSGAERDAYIDAHMLALPTNTSFRDIDELRNVMGMTSDIYNAIAPYLTTRGSGIVNLNTAPEPVLRALPGMTDAIINTIVAYRSQGRRIQSIAEVLPTSGRGGRASNATTATALAARASVDTRDVEFTFVTRVGPQAQPSKLSVVLTHTGTTVNVSDKRW